MSDSTTKLTEATSQSLTKAAGACLCISLDLEAARRANYRAPTGYSAEEHAILTQAQRIIQRAEAELRELRRSALADQMQVAA